MTYALLFLWALVVLVPLYWVLITSFKGPGEVDNGPFYIPFVDFTPSLAAWNFMLIENNTLRPYLNSVVVALGSTVLAVLIGSLAAYALVRIRFQVKLAAVAIFLALLVAVIVAVATFRRALGARARRRAGALFDRAVHAGRPHPARGRQQRHRVLDHLEPHHAADRRGAADLRDVPAVARSSTPRSR